MSHICVIVATCSRDGVRDALYPFWNDDRDEGPSQPHFVFVEDEHADINLSGGRRGYWRNPNGKWDGWTTGGALAGLFDGVDQIEAMQLPAMLQRNPELLAPVYALLIDGQWSEIDKGRAQAWLRATETSLLALPPQTWLTVVDCHC